MEVAIAALYIANPFRNASDSVAPCVIRRLNDLMKQGEAEERK